MRPAVVEVECEQDRSESWDGELEAEVGEAVGIYLVGLIVEHFEFAKK